MEPITLLINLAQHLISYAQEKREQKQYSLVDFQEWMRINNIETLKHLEKNQTALTGIKAILNENHDIVLTELEMLKSIMMDAISMTPIGSELVSAIDPSIALSDQAINIIKQMNRDEVSKILEINQMGDKHYIYSDAPTNGTIEVTDKRFISDDLDKLVEHCFLKKDYNGQGRKVFTITRLGGEVK